MASYTVSSGCRADGRIRYIQVRRCSWRGAVKEYAGGYDDWIAWRKTSAQKQEKPAPAREKQIAQKRKLSFKEKKELEEIPGAIEQKEKRKDEIYAIMSDPKFYAENAANVNALKEEAAQIENDLENLLLRWDELESVEKG